MGRLFFIYVFLNLYTRIPATCLIVPVYSPSAPYILVLCSSYTPYKIGNFTYPLLPLFLHYSLYIYESFFCSSL